MDNRHLADARRMFNALEKGHKPELVPLIVQSITLHMKKAGVGYDQLDPTGERSDSEIRAVIKDHADSHYIGKARTMFRVLEHGAKVDVVAPETVRGFIEENLKKADADYSALDPTGERGNLEMRYAINKAERGAHLRQAKSKFAELKEGLSAETSIAIALVGGKRTPVTVAEEVRQHMSKSGHNYSALDPEGKKSDREMRAELDELAKNGKMEVKDRDTLRDILRTFPRGGRDSGGRGR